MPETGLVEKTTTPWARGGETGLMEKFMENRPRMVAEIMLYSRSEVRLALIK